MFRPFFSPGGARPYQHSETEGYWQITLAEGIKPVVPDTEITNNERTGRGREGGGTNTQLLQPPQIALLLEFERQKRGGKTIVKRKGYVCQVHKTTAAVAAETLLLKAVLSVKRKLKHALITGPNTNLWLNLASTL